MAESIKTAWVTIRDAAEIVGVSVQRIHQLIGSYDLETESINPRLRMMRRRDAERLAKMKRPRGVRRDRRTD